MENKRVAEEIAGRRAALAEAVVGRHYALEPEVWERYGAAGREKSVQDALYHLSFLTEAIAASDAALFISYVNWCKVLFAGIRLPDGALAQTLAFTRDAIRERLSPEMSAVAGSYIDLALVQLPDAPATIPSFLDTGAPLAGLARQYLDALLQGDRRTATRLILDAADQGTPVKDLYLQVFQPVQREVGRLWQTNRLSVAQEHYCTAATQLIMSLLYPRVFASEKVGRTLVSTCVSGELHEIGVRMVADLFEMDGWDTYHLGANTPAASIVRTLAERQADVLAISATMTFHVGRVGELIDAVRASPAAERTRILVGGYPFNLSVGLWRQLGADGFARDAEEAVAVAGTLATEERQG